MSIGTPSNKPLAVREPADARGAALLQHDQVVLLEIEHVKPPAELASEQNQRSR
jgi:hypothetical protein